VLKAPYQMQPACEPVDNLFAIGHEGRQLELVGNKRAISSEVFLKRIIHFYIDVEGR